MSTEYTDQENERLKAAADDIYQQLADNPGIGVPVDPDMIDFLGLTEAPPELEEGDGSEFLSVDENGNHYYAGEDEDNGK